MSTLGSLARVVAIGAGLGAASCADGCEKGVENRPEVMQGVDVDAGLPDASMPDAVASSKRCIEEERAYANCAITELLTGRNVCVTEEADLADCIVSPSVEGSD